MSLPNELHPLQLGAGSASGYQIEQSLRFNSADSATLTRTPSSSGNLRTGTISFWIKRSKLQSQPVQNTQMSLLGCNGNAAGYGAFFLRYRYQYDYLEYGQGWAGGTGGFETLAHYRDVSAWQHVCLVNDFTNATAADKVRLYMNGVRQDLTITSALTNTDSAWNSANLHYIGYQAAYFDGYMAEFHNVDGTALDPDQFGEYDNNGVWRPIRYTGSHGTNGFYLKFDPSATNGIGHDHSGNGNNFSPSGFTADDTMSDTPTNNFMTWNPIVPRSDQTYTWLGVLSEGNLKGTNSGVTYNAENFGTILLPSSGKYYWECTALANVSGEYRFGCVAASAKGSPDSNTGLVYRSSGVVYLNGSSTTSESSWTTNDIISFAADVDGNTLKTYKNGTLEGTYTSFFQSGKQYSAYFFCDETVSSNKQWLLNAGQRAFEHTPPTGHVSVCTANLPAPTVKDGSEYFDTKLYTANNQSAQTITGLAFSPDLLWFKPRNRIEHHYLYDQVRGAGNRISSSQPIAEITGDNSLTAFTSDGFSLGADGAGIVNYSTDSMVAWAWDAGGTGSSNTDGSITSTVSANPTAGFSIVTYTGTGVNATVGHGLGIHPSFYVVKPRSEANNWPCWHKDLTSDGYYIHLNFALKQDLATAVWNGTGPSSTVFNIGTNTNVNQLDATFVAYVFAEVEGYSRISSYSGNGLPDGPFVYCGFRPAFVLIKNYRGGSETNWIMRDSARSPYNKVHPSIYANTSAAEINNFDMDFLSNGFKIKDDNAVFNESGSDYLFLAFAENPFGGSGVSPATAR